MSLILLALPLITALFAYFVKQHSKTIAMFGAVVNLVLTLYIAYVFEIGFNGMQFSDSLFTIPNINCSFDVGINAISLLFLILTNISLPLIIATSPKQVDKNSLFFALISFFSFALHGVYLISDGLFYYVFWEMALLPIFVLLIVFGGQQSMQTFFKFFIYTIAGSLFMLVSIVLLRNNTNGFAWEAWTNNTLSPTLQAVALIGFAAAYFIKIPIFPFHTWQPDTYTKAPTTVTMLLSAVMLKMAIYSILRWVIPILPTAFEAYRMVGLLLSVIGVVYASIIAIQQTDLKRLLAYSSMAHVGMIAAGIFSGSNIGSTGAILQCINHAIISIGLFYIADLLQHRFGTYDIHTMGGVRQYQPILATFLMILTLASVAMPLTNGFVGEFMILIGIYDLHPVLCAVAGLSVVLGAVYMLRMYMLTMLGDSQVAVGFADLTLRDSLILIPIVILIFTLGLFPVLFSQFLI